MQWLFLVVVVTKTRRKRRRNKDRNECAGAYVGTDIGAGT